MPQPSIRSRDRGEALSSLTVAVAIAAMLVAALTAALSATLASTSSTTTQLSESNDVQLVADSFAADVQAMAEVTTQDCGTQPSESPVVAIERGDGAVVAYYSNSTEASLTRRVCDQFGTVIVSRKLARDLAATAPGVVCDGAACVAGTDPDEISMTIVEATGSSFELIGARRFDAGAGALRWRFVVLGQGAGVFRVNGGNASMSVNGDALITSTSTSWYQGTAGGLNVTGSFTQQLIPDPLASLPYPSTGSLPVYTDGVYHGPGVYRTAELGISSNLTMAPGTYILENGMKITGSSTVNGTGVFLFNGCAAGSPATCANTGNFTSGGSARLDLSAPTSGMYKNILLFQNRTNVQPIKVGGSTAITSLNGMIYAPSADPVILGSGTSGMSVGGVIANKVEISGSGGVNVG